jgi:hypothetical protein
MEHAGIDTAICRSLTITWASSPSVWAMKETDFESSQPTVTTRFRSMGSGSCAPCAMELNTNDATAPYLLGNFLFDWQIRRSNSFGTIRCGRS